MARIEKSIEVDAPLHTVYNQWTQFESFPQFMEGVKQVEQLDDKHLRWHAQILGKDETWTADIVEQVPDNRIAWRSTSGARNDGAVSFQGLSGGKTRVNLVLEYDPQGPMEKTGDALGLVEHRVEDDLKRFKKFIESRGSETGAWRGEIHGGQVDKSSGSKK